MKKSFLPIVLLIVLIVIFGTIALRKYISAAGNNTVFMKADLNAEKIQPKTYKDVLVAIDPGHGGDEPGTVNFGAIEKDINLDISLRLDRLLNDAGVATLMTRRDDRMTGLKKRAAMANDAGADLFISIHNNNLPGYPDICGTETLYASPDNPIKSEISGKRLAEIVQDELTSKIGTKNLNLSYRPELAVLHRTNMPSVISEIAFMSNRTEKEALSTPSFREKAAAALKDAILKALAEDGAKKDVNGRWVISK